MSAYRTKPKKINMLSWQRKFGNEFGLIKTLTETQQDCRAKKLSLTITQWHVWQSQVEIEHYPLCNSTALLRLKRCSTKLLLRAGLIHTAKMHQYLISLHSTYEPRKLCYSTLNTVMRSKYAME